MNLPEAAPNEKPVSTRLLLTVLVLAPLLAVIAGDMVNPVLPYMRQEFGVSEAQVGWVVSGYLLVFSIGIPFYGRISDSFGLRRLFSSALLVFAAGNLVCALAPLGDQEYSE